MSKLFVVLTVAILLSSCSKKYITAMFSSDSYQKDEITKHVRMLVKTDKMWQISYTLDVPKEALRVEGKVRIIRDSLIWMNVKKMGIEAMRIKLTRDSVWILDRLKNKYFEGSYDSFEKFAKMPFSFRLSQAIFLNEPYLDLVQAENANFTDSLVVYSSSLQNGKSTLDIQQSYFSEPVYLKGFAFFSAAIQTKGSIEYRYGKKYKMKGFQLKTSNKNLPEAYFKTKVIETKDKLSVRFKIPRRYEKIVIN